MTKKVTIMQRCMAAEKNLENAAREHGKLIAVHNAMAKQLVIAMEALACAVHHINGECAAPAGQEFIITDDERRECWEFSRLRIDTQPTDDHSMICKPIEWTEEERAELDEAREAAASEAKKPKLLGPTGELL